MNKQVLNPLGLLAVAMLIAAFAASKYPEQAQSIVLVLGVVGAGLIIWFSQTFKPEGGGASLDGIAEAVGQAARGRKPRAPEDASEDVAEVYDALAKVAKKHAELTEENERLSEEGGGADLSKLTAAVNQAQSGKAPRVPSGADDDEVALYEALRGLAEKIASAGDGGDTSELEAALAEAEQRAARAQKQASEAAEALARLEEQVHASGDRVDIVVEAARPFETLLPQLATGVSSVLDSSQSADDHVRDVTASLHEVAQSIEMLATSAEESSSSILEMTATNDEVAENVGELAGSVRETVSSIEEMAYSIREVAKNVDALSLTAEETSSSMNEMDVSIDQVQSNANETARLSEEVATDAERGAEAILKTIGEIYRIKESSQEAVSVISNLGFRIEAIGQILAVIDDVAEQTNLLALNAAIIAAQAGEHGKGFAVVADEIKDLAERAGGSTKEIAELIKTIQSESKNAIAAVERGAHNVDRGVEVSNEAERALKKILESSQKSTNMVRAIARATVEQAKGSKQVTDAIGRIAETVQQIAAATAQQARGSELIMKSAEKMRAITQHVERSSQEQARGGRQITTAIEQISNMVNALNSSQRTQTRGGEQLLEATRQIAEAARDQDKILGELLSASEKLRRQLDAS